jgi:hypothetical protein
MLLVIERCLRGSCNCAKSCRSISMYIEVLSFSLLHTITHHRRDRLLCLYQSLQHDALARIHTHTTQTITSTYVNYDLRLTVALH